MSDEYALQEPEEDLDYSHDWSNDLDDAGSPSDTISSSTWTIEGGTGAGGSPALLHDDAINGSITSVFVKDLVYRQIYTLRNVMVTAQGRTFSHTWTLECGKR